MKKKINLLFIAVGLMSFCGWSGINKRQLISCNIEALTKSWESQKVDGADCMPVELGRAATAEEKERFSGSLTYHPCSIDESADSIPFYEFDAARWVPLPKCGSNYYYAFGNGAYCY